MFEQHFEAVQAILRARGLAGEPASAGAEPEASAGPGAGVAKPAVLEAVAAHLGWSCLHEVPATLPAELVAQLDPGLGRHYGAIPLAAEPGRVDLLTTDPFDPRALADLAFALGREARFVVADPDAVAALIRRHYGAEGDGVAGFGAAPAATAGPGHDELGRLAAQPPVVKLVDELLARAVRERASDLHFEPFEQEFQIRIRVDGTLRSLPPPAAELALPVVSRLKVMAGLDIAERRRPQDGRIRLVQAGRPVDLRMSTLPTQSGESVVLRVLETPADGQTLAGLGLPADVLAGIAAAIRRPHGLLVVTGPTGSGKTTTLYAALRELNEPGVKILTVEDPVEYELDGVVQVAVQPAIGRTFAGLLRAFLRHDPDVIMVGEIRDAETAQVAIQAALTGHRVLSTLHTGDAPGAVARLADMGVEPYLIAAALQGVLAQRLVPRICPDCREPVVPAAGRLAELTAEAAAGRPAYRGRGCARCGQRGTRGRTGLFEWMPVDERLRDLIAGGAPADAVRSAACAAGLRTLRADGLRAVFAGEATVEDILHVV